MQKEKKRELYYKRKEAGLCVGCGKPNNNGKVYCDDCLEYHRWSNAKSVATASDEKREKRKANIQRN